MAFQSTEGVCGPERCRCGETLEDKAGLKGVAKHKTSPEAGASGASLAWLKQALCKRGVLPSPPPAATAPFTHRDGPYVLGTGGDFTRSG